MKTIITSALSLAAWLANPLFAQDIDAMPWAQRDRQQIKPLAYEPIREADVFWSKNIWRVVDTRQKMNKPFAYPQRPMIAIIHEAAKKGELTVYDPAVENADQFQKVLEVDAINKIGYSKDSMPQTNVFSGEEEMGVIENNLTWDRIKKFKIKEVWFFEENTGTMRVRILGIAPIMEYYSSEGTYLGDMTMYWVPYASMRAMLAKDLFLMKGMMHRCTVGRICWRCGSSRATFTRKAMSTTGLFRSMQQR